MAAALSRRFGTSSRCHVAVYLAASPGINVGSLGTCMPKSDLDEPFLAAMASAHALGRLAVALLMAMRAKVALMGPGIHAGSTCKWVVHDSATRAQV